MKNCTPGLVPLLDISGSKNKMAEAVSGISFDMHSKATFKNATTTFIRLIWVGVPLIWVSLAGFGWVWVSFGSDWVGLAGFGWVWVSLARFGWEHGLEQPLFNFET